MQHLVDGPDNIWVVIGKVRCENTVLTTERFDLQSHACVSELSRCRDRCCNVATSYLSQEEKCNRGCLASATWMRYLMRQRDVRDVQRVGEDFLERLQFLNTINSEFAGIVEVACSLRFRLVLL